MIKLSTSKKTYSYSDHERSCWQHLLFHWWAAQDERADDRFLSLLRQSQWAQGQGKLLEAHVSQHLSHWRKCWMHHLLHQLSCHSAFVHQAVEFHIKKFKTRMGMEFRVKMVTERTEHFWSARDLTCSKFIWNWKHTIILAESTKMSTVDYHIKTNTQKNYEARISSIECSNYWVFREMAENIEGVQCGVYGHLEMSESKETRNLTQRHQQEGCEWSNIQRSNKHDAQQT